MLIDFFGHIRNFLKNVGASRDTQTVRSLSPITFTLTTAIIE
jgi:hypothetical protein